MSVIKRLIEDKIRSDLDQKIVLLSGPRQVGKTTLSRSLFPTKSEYLNFDAVQDRARIREQSWDRSQDLVIFDELHKLPKWKSWVKGVYDTEGVRPRILVTGSARLETLKKGGDSLAGRHHFFRLLPFSPAELQSIYSPAESIRKLLLWGGFPEPFLNADEVEARRWRKSHLDRILKEDLLELEPVREIKKIEFLIDLLANRVGSTISHLSLARDLEVSPHTVKKWISILESLYVIFVIRPYSKNISRSLLKEPKIYFYDIGRVTNGEGARAENLVALCLLKDLYFKEDVLGHKTELSYIRDREKREVDFITVIDQKINTLIEVKTSDTNLSAHLKHFHELLKPSKTLQLTLPRDDRARDLNGIRVCGMDEYLPTLEKPT